MDLPWSAVNVLASDERAVPADHAKRNERALAEAFAAAGGLKIHPLLPSNASSASPLSLQTAEASLGPLHRQGFDAVLLGMGLDAHFASLFPAVTPRAALDAGDATVAVAVTPHPLPPEAPFPRISLSLSRLISARVLMLMITGDAKRRVLEESRQRPAIDAPIHALLAAAPDLAVHWSP
jgi:6-phosphogluconolactonase